MPDALMDKLAELLDEIVMRQPGAWKDKADAIRAAMEAREATTNLEEFVNWFQG